jgi:hypothetical protein
MDKGGSVTIMAPEPLTAVQLVARSPTSMCGPCGCVRPLTPHLNVSPVHQGRVARLDAATHAAPLPLVGADLRNRSKTKRGGWQTT